MLTCVDCRGEWEFGPGEREWFQFHGVRLPRRCAPCRDRRRAKRADEERLSGVVLSVREERGFGFIRAEDGSEVFFRTSDANGARLVPGARVSYVLGDHATGRRPRASLIRNEST